MSKKFLITLAFLLILSSLSYAQACEVDSVKQVLRKSLYLQLQEPKSNPLTLNEVKDLLVFYLGISKGVTTIDCSPLGAKSNKPISDIIDAGKNAPDKIPTCADSTKYGECSSFKPKYCYAGSLLHRCDYCGCPSPSGCSTSGKCEPLTNVKNIKGRLINYLTNQPIPNAIVYTWDNQTTKRSVYSNSNGEFSVEADTSLVTSATPKSFGINMKCYDNIGFAILKKPDNSFYVNVQINSLIGPAKAFPITSSEVNLGDIPIWPAVDFALNSDIPVKFKIDYNGTRSSGNGSYETAHYLTNSVPLTVNVRALLTDVSGNAYYSPYINLPLSHGCGTVTLNFSNNQFEWVE